MTLAELHQWLEFYDAALAEREAQALGQRRSQTAHFLAGERSMCQLVMMRVAQLEKELLTLSSPPVNRENVGFARKHEKRRLFDLVNQRKENLC